jgi:hypothetical protein
MTVVSPTRMTESWRLMRVFGVMVAAAAGDAPRSTVGTAARMIKIRFTDAVSTQCYRRANASFTYRTDAAFRRRPGRRRD